MERDCLRRMAAHFLFILVSTAALFAAPARAVDPADLLPVDEAFALSAQPWYFTSRVTLCAPASAMPGSTAWRLPR